MKRPNSNLPRPEDFPPGSVASRAAVRAMLKRAPGTTIRATIVHVGHAGLLPAPQRIKWNGGVTEIVHVSGDAGSAQIDSSAAGAQIHFVIPLQPKQAILHDLFENSQHTRIGVGGSRGGAKSYAARAVMLLRRLKHPNTRGMIFRRKFSDLWENHIQPLFSQFPFMRQWYNVQNKELTLPNGAVIAFRYAEHEGDIDDFLGKEYMDICIDEATQLSERSLVKFEGCNRWPALPQIRSKILHTMNPGGPGHPYMRRIYLKREYRAGENADEYAFVIARAWDNVEWAKEPLAGAKLSVKQYYEMPDEERFQFFVARTQYGRQLNALPPALRIGWLLGDWEQFAGQYFDCFDPAKHVRPCGAISEWEPRWLGIDWGFAHDSACYWNARDGAKIKTYREMVLSGRSPRALAQEIVDRTPVDERPHIDAIYLSHDAFAQRTSPDTIALQMGEVFRANGMPEPIQADKDTIGGAALVYELLRSGEWEINSSCVKLIECLPMVTRDEADPEKTVKFEGDDPYDAIRYAMKLRLGEVQKPYARRVEERLAQITYPGDPLVAVKHSMMMSQERRPRPVPFRRRWRPGTSQPPPHRW